MRCIVMRVRIVQTGRHCFLYLLELSTKATPHILGSHAFSTEAVPRRRRQRLLLRGSRLVPSCRIFNFTETDRHRGDTCCVPSRPLPVLNSTRDQNRYVPIGTRIPDVPRWSTVFVRVSKCGSMNTPPPITNNSLRFGLLHRIHGRISERCK